MLLESESISREEISRSKSIDVTVPSSNWLFYAFLYFPVAFPDLEIKVADFISSESPSLNLPSYLFLTLPFYQVYGQYHMYFLSKVHLLQTIALVMRLNCVSMHLTHLQFDMVGLYLLGYFFVFLFLSLSHAVCCLSLLCCCC